jgi:hypothetical protein
MQLLQHGVHLHSSAYNDLEKKHNDLEKKQAATEKELSIALEKIKMLQRRARRHFHGSSKPSFSSLNATSKSDLLSSLLARDAANASSRLNYCTNEDGAYDSATGRASVCLCVNGNCRWYLPAEFLTSVNTYGCDSLYDYLQPGCDASESSATSPWTVAYQYMMGGSLSGYGMAKAEYAAKCIDATCKATIFPGGSTYTSPGLPP